LDPLIDGVTDLTLSEVKNFAHLSYTSQLRDFAAIAKREGLLFDLYVRPSTTFSSPLLKELQSGAINLKFIPGTK
jgi:hypothetical protein